MGIEVSSEFAMPQTKLDKNHLQAQRIRAEFGRLN
jgi:hypothetical protein